MGKGVVTFSFDDGSPGWVLAAQVLEKFGFRGTFNVTIRNIVKRGMPFVAFPFDRVIQERDLIKLQEHDHEIGSHGLRHIQLKLCNDVELFHELKTSKDVLESLGLKVRTFTCPFSNWSEQVKDEVLKYYDSMRYGIGVNRMPFDKRTYMSVLGSDDLKAAIDRATIENLWVVLLFHNVKRNNDDNFSTDLETFTNIVRYVFKKNIQVKTVSEMIKYAPKTHY